MIFNVLYVCIYVRQYLTCLGRFCSKLKCKSMSKEQRKGNTNLLTTYYTRLRTVKLTLPISFIVYNFPEK